MEYTNDYEWLSKFVSNMANFKVVTSIDDPNWNGNYIRASVSIILRVRPRNHPVSPTKNLEEFMNADWTKRGCVDFLFAKKVIRERDPWSGHVAFPGGKREIEESDLECAIRETQEEIGVDLCNKSQFSLIGQLPSYTPPYLVSSKKMIVYPFVWLKITHQDLSFKIQDTELSSVFWIPLSHFSDPNPDLVWFYHYTWDTIVGLPHFIATTLQKHIPSGFSSPGFALIPLEEHFSSSQHETKESRYQVFGMTLEFTQQCLRISGFRFKRLDILKIKRRWLFLETTLIKAKRLHRYLFPKAKL